MQESGVEGVRGVEGAGAPEFERPLTGADAFGPATGLGESPATEPGQYAVAGIPALSDVRDSQGSASARASKASSRSTFALPNRGE